MRTPAFFLLLFLIFFSCKKGEVYKIDASKITVVDENGDPAGENDPTDWRFDDEWNAKELALFNFEDSITTWGMQNATTLSASAAPNPASSVIMFSFMVNKPTLLKWVITDEHLNVLFQKVARLENSSNINPNQSFGLDVKNSKFKAPGFYRIYYAFYSQDKGLYKKGHGDFQKL